jgi:hypothetical protein
MPINPEAGIHGYLATDPRLTRTGGRARFYVRLGVRRRERTPGARPEPDYLDLILFDRPAEQAHELYRRGDDVIALGRLIPPVPDPAGGAGRDAQFIAERLGPDTNHLAISVRRTLPKEPA